MLTLLTAQGTSIPITWIGISELDGSLRFEVDVSASDEDLNSTLHSSLSTLFSIFSDPEHTRTLTRVFDEDRKTFEGFTGFKGIERMGTGNIVIRLIKGTAV